MNVVQTIPDIAFGWVILACIIAVGICLLCVSSARKSQTKRVHESFGLDARVVYMDRGAISRSFICHKFGIVAKPDYILRTPDGTFVLTEYKSRESGYLFDSDIAQVKASVLAARSRYNITRAIVLVGTTRHEIQISKSSETLYKDIRVLAEHARNACAGELVTHYATNPNQCARCFSRPVCRNPAVA